MAQALDIFYSDMKPWEHWSLRAEDKLATWDAGIVEGRSTGLPSIDKWTRLIDGDLIIVAARPSMGKTALGMQIAESVATELSDNQEAGCVAIFSAEMAGLTLYLRMASARCGVNFHKARSGKATKQEYAILRDEIQRMKYLPLWVDENTAPTTDQMLQGLAELSKDIPVRLMVFDFMELGGDRDSREDIRIGNIGRNLKGIAKTLNIPVIALSQLNREVDTRATKTPQLSDLRYSGMIEQLADVVIMLNRPEYYVESGQDIKVERESDLTGTALVYITKNRNGPRGMSRMAFMKDRILFGDLQEV
jgi:replicative DNA helicase